MSYTVTDYLLDRLHEVGVEHVFGVPGDFTLSMLDHIEADARIEWVGCANELGAGYAADGYGRIRRMGALCTTFGVGELSAVNAVAGSFAEHVPVLHVVGAPATGTQAAARATHHTLGDGDFRHFARMSTEVTCAEAFLTAANAEDEIDRVITEVLERRLPGYLSIPTDVGESSATPPSAPLPAHPGVTNPQALAAFEARVRSLMLPSRSIAILADILVQRMGASDELHALLDATGAPHATLMWGRRVVDESAASYLGSYVGAVSAPGVREPIERSDVLIMAGVQWTDLTSGFFSEHLATERTVDVGPRSASVAGETFAPIAMTDALAALVEIAGTLDSATASPAVAHPVRDQHEHAEPLSQATLWDTVADALLPHDLVLADQGTSFYGMGTHRLPHDVVFIGQPLWASIGYTLPAFLGAALAASDRRPVVLIGDGAAQLTAAELGTIQRNGLGGIVVVVDNDGYTIERAIRGRHANYNTIARWDWPTLANALGAGARTRAGADAGADASTVGLVARTVGLVARTVGELRDALAGAQENPSRLTVVQAVVPALDVPPLLAALAAQASSANARPQAT